MRKFLVFLTIVLFIAAIATSGKEEEHITVENTVDIFNHELHFTAHRGASDVAPENTVPAFETAAREGFWGIETDVSETKDGEFVCMHDETIDRTTTGSGKISEYSIGQLMKFDIDVGSNISNYEDLKIPKLSDYLAICKKYGCVAVVEIKRITHYSKLINLLDESGCQIIITGGIDSLKEVRRINKIYPLMIIGYAPNTAAQYVAEADSLGSNCGLLLNHPMLDDEAAGLIQQKNYYCAVWTVNDNKMAVDFFNKYGVDFIVADSAVCMKK